MIHNARIPLKITDRNWNHNKLIVMDHFVSGKEKKKKKNNSSTIIMYR